MGVEPRLELVLNAGFAWRLFACQRRAASIRGRASAMGRACASGAGPSGRARVGTATSSPRSLTTAPPA